MRFSVLLSLSIHLLFLGIPIFDLPVPGQEKEVALQVEIEKIPLLPKIKVMGEEKKIKKMIMEEQEQIQKPEAELLSKPEEAVKKEKEFIEVINPQDDAMFRYQDMVKQRIEEARRYPSWAKRQKIEGKVYVRFIILQDGTVREIEVSGSSGYRMLDEESVATIKRAGVFPPIPEKMGLTQLQMELAIIYTLKRR